MIKIENIEKSFGKLNVLKSVSAELSGGKVVCIIGPNGSGKTTLIKCLLGMVLPDAGNIYFDGKLIFGDEHYRENIGYMPQIGRYPENMNIGQIILMMKDLRKNIVQLDEEILHEYQLNSMLQKPMRTLSGGTTQKVSAALAFLFNPQVLILDEPTAGLDPIAAEILKNKILKRKEEGKLIIITSHIMSEIDELADEILYMQDGKIKFHKSISELKSETEESKLGKAISKIITKQIHD